MISFIKYLSVLLFALLMSSCDAGSSNYRRGPIESALTPHEAQILFSDFVQCTDELTGLMERTMNHPENFDRYKDEIQELLERMDTYKAKIEEAYSNGLISEDEMQEMELSGILIGNEILERLSNTEMGSIVGL